MKLKLPVINNEADFLNTIEELSKDPLINMGDVNSISKKIAIKASDIMGVNRVNIWIIRENTQIFDCVAAYNADQQIFYKEYPIQIGDYRDYFLALKKNTLLATSDIESEDLFAELIEDYFGPKNIKSLIHVAIRPEGRISGVICFEQEGFKREWTLPEQQFALALGQIIAITMENNIKIEVHKLLDKNLSEKDIMISEVAHCVKKNLHVISRMIQSAKICHTPEALKENADALLDRFIFQVKILETIQDSMFRQNQYKEIEIDSLIVEIVDKIKQDLNCHGMNINTKLDEIKLKNNEVIALTLIISNVLHHYCKTVKNDNHTRVKIYLENIYPGHVSLTITEFFDPSIDAKGVFSSLCPNLISDLTHDIHAKVANYSSEGESSLIINFRH